MTKEEAINILKNPIVRFGRTNGKTVYAEALQTAIKALEEPHWIPCSERLPSEGDTVLLYENYAYSIGRLIKTTTGEYEWSVNGWYTEIDDWSAWMPLPEPYGGESE